LVQLSPSHAAKRNCRSYDSGRLVMRMPLTFLILSREIVFSERTHHRLQLKTRVDSSDDHVKQIRRVHQRTPITMCRVYASNVRRTSRTVWSLCLLRYDPLDPGEPPDSATTSSAILHDPRKAVPRWTNHRASSGSVSCLRTSRAVHRFLVPTRL
jgi:hypothetical protein